MPNITSLTHKDGTGDWISRYDLLMVTKCAVVSSVWVDYWAKSGLDELQLRSYYIIT